jgi:hypothetical protein
MITKRICLVIFIIYCLGLNNSFSQYDDPNFHMGFKDSLEYGVFVPPSYNPAHLYPLVLHLHGYTVEPFWGYPWFQNALQEQEPSFLLIPKCPYEWGGAAWGGTYDPDLRNSLKLTLEVIDSLKKIYSIDPRRIYMFGNSMGGEGVFALMAFRPTYFAAAVSVAGYTKTGHASAMVTTPLWIIHGGNDNLAPTSSSQDIYAAIKDAGGLKVRYSEYPGYDHYSIWSYVTQETSIVPWMLAQKRDSVFTGRPNIVRDFDCVTTKSGIHLTWDKPLGSTEPWYYSIFRNDTLLAELRSSNFDYTDIQVSAQQKSYYKITSTSYNFIESEPVVKYFSPTSVSIESNESKKLIISDCYPNPSNRTTNIQFSLPEAAYVVLKIFDSLGHEVAILANEELGPGNYTREWDTEGIVNGVYLYRIEVGSFVETKKIVLSK